MEQLVDNYPVLCYDEVYKVGKLRKDLQDGVLDRVETPVQNMRNNHETENDQYLEHMSKQEESTPKQSANLEALYELVQMIDQEMKFAMHPPFTGKIRQDNMVRAKLVKYYTTSIKKYAKQIRIYIDALIKYDNYPAYMFDDYVRLEKLVQHTDSEIADEYLLKLLNISRQMIPPNLHTQNSFVIDSNGIDPNKVNE